MAFSVETIDLTSVDPETGLNNTANVYRVDGIDRQLSIGELAMVICLAEAVKQENSVTAIMAEMNQTTYRLEQLAALEDALTVSRTTSGATQTRTGFNDIGLGNWQTDFPKTSSDWPSGTSNEYWDNWLKYEAGVSISATAKTATVSGVTYYYYTMDEIDTIITSIETKMDELNTFSQEKMIELQSATNKRDQAYDLASALLKSFNTVLSGTVSNI